MHIVSGSLNAGVNASDGEVDEVIKAMWKILSDSPAWRDMYLKSIISGKLPQQFCGTWWVENDDTAEKAILVWRDIVGLIEHLALSPSRRLKNSESFDKLTHKSMIS